MKSCDANLMRLSVWLAILVAVAEVHARPTVYVVNYPLRYFTERIAGDSVNVVLPVPAGEDPAFWKPDMRTIAALQGADLLLINGATYEKWLTHVSLPRAKVVNTSQSFKARYLPGGETVTHSHGPTGAHSHAGTAFTTWLNFQFAAAQAQAVAQALERLVPAQRARFATNFAVLEQDLLALDQRLAALSAARRAQPLLASHPVYQYLAQRYGLQMQSVLWEPDTMPDEKAWQHLQTLLDSHKASWMLWERQPLSAAVDKLQAMGVRSLVFDPCSNTPEQGDFLTVMQQNVANLQHAFQTW